MTRVRNAHAAKNESLQRTSKTTSGKNDQKRNQYAIIASDYSQPERMTKNDCTAIAVQLRSLPFLRLLGGQEKRRWVCAVVCYAQCVETGQPGSAIGKPSLEAVGGVTAAPIVCLFFLAPGGG